MVLFESNSFILYLITVTLFFVYFGAAEEECKVSRCGDHGPPIRFPFWIKDIQPVHCGYPGFEVYCNQRKQTVLELPVSVKMVIKKIDYVSKKIHVYDPENCAIKKLPSLNLSASPYSFNKTQVKNLVLLNCTGQRRKSLDLLPCLSVGHSYVYGTFNSRVTQDMRFCIKIRNISSVPLNLLKSGEQNALTLIWEKPDCRTCEEQGKMCGWKNYNTTASQPPEFECLQAIKTATGLTSGMIFLISLVAAFYYAYTSYIKVREEQIKIEKFLADYKALKPARYSFADIKRITNQFKHKLGKGSYGTVFKGKLSNKVFVAVKLLESSTGNGEEFTNEVRTMGRIHHVNVVRLVGFCAEGFKRALVYEFLPNESLENFIFSKSPNKNFLGWEKLQEIALGIAKGIEYLHQGCDHRILHFDIKPHNILLDQNFVPKVADFGLAKLCSKEQSIVSMSNCRGTMGYIAPEVFSRNFGNVSYKSDVYSYGMLMLEMVGGRKNIELTAPNSNQTYFPEWIYNRLIQGEGLGIRFEEEHTKIAKQLSQIGLWCIQWNPINRPSMKTVVQMIEGNGDALSMPPNPFVSTSHSQSSIRPSRGFNVELEIISEAE